MKASTLLAPLASIKCDVCDTLMRAADQTPGPLTCPTCGRWCGVVLHRGTK